MHETGDTGAYLRTTTGALVLFGVPPEEYWPNPPHTDPSDRHANNTRHGFVTLT